MAASVLAFSTNSFTIPKLTIALVACLVGASADRVGRLPRSVLIIGGLGLAVVVTASLFGGSPMASLAGRWPRYEGVPMLLGYAAVAWLGARVVGPNGLAWRRAEQAIAGLGTALGLLTLLALAGRSPVPPATSDRIGTVLGNATDHGLIAMTVVLCLVPGTIGERRPWLWVGMVGGLVALVGSASRAPLATTLVLAVAALIWQRPGVGATPGRRPLLLIGAAAAPLALLLLIPGLRGRMLTSATFEGRVLQWGPTLDLVRDHLALGIGPSRYLTEFPRYETHEWVAWAGPYRMVDSPHSWLLQAVVVGGIPLLVVALSGLAAVVHAGLDHVRADPRRTGLFLAVLGYAIATLPHFTNPTSTLWAAFLVGVLVARPARVESALRERTAVGLVAAACLVASSAWVGDAYLDRGMQHARQGDVEAAAASFRDANTWRPWDVDVRTLAARAMAEQASIGSVAAADAGADLARSALTSVPDDYEATVALGASLITTGDLTEAITVLDTAVALAPQRPAAYVQRAVAHLASGDRESARSDLGQARRLAPRDVRVRDLLRLTVSGESAS